MKVLYICADWGIPIRGFKGASVHVREFVSALTRGGNEVWLLCTDRGEGNPDPDATVIEIEPRLSQEKREKEAARLGLAFDPQDVAVCHELDKLSYDTEFAARALAELSEREFRPDVVYERYSLFHASGARLARTFEVPYVLEVNAPLIEEQERHRVLRLKALAQEMQTRCFREADSLITVSEPLKQYLQAQGIAADRISCLANGVDTRRFHPDIDPEPIRTRYSLGQQPVVGFLGSLKPWHGMDFLLDAMVQLRRRQRDQRLLIVGEGPGLEHIRERVRNNALEEHVRRMVGITQRDAGLDRRPQPLSGEPPCSVGVAPLDELGGRSRGVHLGDDQSCVCIQADESGHRRSPSRGEPGSGQHVMNGGHGEHCSRIGEQLDYVAILV